MPVRLLTRAERDRLAGFPVEVSRDDLRASFGLTPADQVFVRRRRGDANRLGLALQLGCVRLLGFVPDLASLPAEVVEVVARQVDVPASIGGYGEREQTRSDHLAEVLEHVGFRQPGELDLKRLREWLVDRAMEHHRPLVLFEQACAWLAAERLVRPGVTVIERMIAAALNVATVEAARRLDPMLSARARQRLDDLLQPDPNLGMSRLVWLRLGVSSVSPAGVLDGVDKIRYLRALGADRWDLSALNPNRVRYLAGQGRAATPQHLARASEERRYPTLAAFCVQALADLTDETLDVYCATLARAASRTRRAHRDELADLAATMLNGWSTLVRVGALVIDAADHHTNPVAAIDAEIGLDTLRGLLRDLPHAGLAGNGDGFFDHLNRRYAWLRQFTPAVIEAFEYHARPTDPDLIDAVDVLARLNRTGGRKVPDDASTGFATGRWRGRLYRSDGSIDRHMWEMATLYELRDRLRSGDVWVTGGRRYNDPDTLLLPDDAFSNLRSDLGRLTGTPPCVADRLAQAERDLQARAIRLEQRLGDGIRIEEGRPVLTHLAADPANERSDEIRGVIAERLPRIDLAEVLIEVDAWCGYTNQLTHAAGATPRSTDHRKLLYASILAQACNLGITAMGEISDVTARQLAWTTDWYLREDTLRAAVTEIVNHHHSLPTSALWGAGVMSSSDGQRFPVPVTTTTATALPRYFNRGRGVEMYTWTSDQYSQYGSKVIPATVRDATYVLDELLDNEVDLPIVEHTTDTAGYTDLVFGLFDLLGLTFSPRIRDLTHQRLYRLAPIPEAPNVETMLRHRVNTDLIARHWDDMLRIAASLKFGHVTASLLVTRLQAGARRNQPTKAIQELGRIAKTRFLLAYLENETYRRRIQRQLNKGETLHALRRYIFFANQAQIRHRRPEDQTNQALCLNLVTNAVITWNTVYITATIDQLRHDGAITPDDDLRRRSPTVRDHINPYGRYTFNLEEPTTALRPLRQTEQTFDP